jgi:LysM repeat protein
MNSARQYLLRSSTGASVLVYRGDGSPKMVGGGGGWDTVSRPRRVALTLWNGRDPYAMDIPILFDGWADDTSVEAAIARLNQMQMSPGPNVSPPTVQIDGAVPVKGATWVITSIDWGDNVIWTQDGNSGYRLRQDAVVHLLQFVAEEKLHIARAKIAPGQFYTTKSGDTLKSVAKKKYGDASKWKVIANANNIRDPKKVHAGMHLRIPPLPKPTSHPTKNT